MFYEYAFYDMELNFYDLKLWLSNVERSLLHVLRLTTAQSIKKDIG